MATIPFIAYEISGVTWPIYNSGAANRQYVMAVSGGLSSRITAGGGVQNTAFQTLTASTGITPFTATTKISGLSAQTISILGYSTISGNAKLAYNYINPSGALLANLLSSGNEYTSAYKYINPSGGLLANLLASGNEYTKAYKSGLASKSHAYHAKISSAYLAVNYGWATATNGSATIAHSLLSLPKSHWVVPSGLISFGIVTKVDTTNITASITAAGSRILQWWASV